MYIDGFLNALFLIMAALQFSSLIVIQNASKSFSYKTVLILLKIIKIAIYLFFSIVIFIVGFFKIKYLGTYILLCIISIGLIVYTLLDISYFQGIKNEYIAALQDQFCKKDNLDKLFERIDDNQSKFELIKDDPRQKYGYIISGQYGECITNNSQKVLYKPKKQMSNAFLSFYAKCFEIDLQNIPIFNDDASFEKYLSKYQHIGPSRLYYWLKSKEKVFRYILYIAFALVVTAFVIIMILIDKNVIDVDGILSKEIG